MTLNYDQDNKRSLTSKQQREINLLLDLLVNSSKIRKHITKKKYWSEKERLRILVSG